MTMDEMAESAVKVMTAAAKGGEKAAIYCITTCFIDGCEQDLRTVFRVDIGSGGSLSCGMCLQHSEAFRLSIDVAVANLERAMGRGCDS